MLMGFDKTSGLSDRTLGLVVCSALAENKLPGQAEVSGDADMNDIPAWNALLNELTKRSWAQSPLRGRWLAEQMRRQGAIRIVRR